MNPFPANTDRTDYQVKYRIVASNGVGYGIESDDTQVLTSTFPAKMATVNIDGDITPLSIKIDWIRLTTSEADTGRDPITNYQLEWLPITTPATTTWTVLTTAPETDSSLTVTSGFTINTKYQIRVTAINGVGLGQYSDVLEILTDNVPTRMNDPAEDPSTNANFIKVTWTGITDDADTGRDAITYYKLEWDQGLGGTTNWVELTTPGTLVYEFSQT